MIAPEVTRTAEAGSLHRCKNKLAQRKQQVEITKMEKQQGRNWAMESTAEGSVVTTTASERRRIREAGLGYMYWFAYMCAVASLLLVFVAFSSPYWFKSWGRVHSPLANVGMWQICLSGWMKPRDPSMRSYVGCWWIHSTFFEDVFDDIMPRKCRLDTCVSINSK